MLSAVCAAKDEGCLSWFQLQPNMGCAAVASLCESLLHEGKEDSSTPTKPAPTDEM